MAIKTLDQHIEITPGVAGGKPRIAGHRITVLGVPVGEPAGAAHGAIHGLNRRGAHAHCF